MTARRDRRGDGGAIAVLVALVFLTGLLASHPADAQIGGPVEPGTTETTTPPTAPPTTEAPIGGTTATTQPGGTASTTPSSTEPDAETTTTTVTGSTKPGGTTTTAPGGTTTTISVPPLPGSHPVGDPVGNGDAPSEAVPQVPYTVPPRLEGDPILAGLPGAKVFIGDIKVAQDDLAAAQLLHDTAVARVAEIDGQLRAAKAKVGQLRSDQVTKVNDLTDLQKSMADKVADAYIGGFDVADGPSVLVGSKNATDYGQRRQYASSVLESLRKTIDKLTKAKEQLGPNLVKLAQLQATLGLQLIAAQKVVEQSNLRLLTAGFAVQVFAAGSAIFVSGFVFPVADPHQFIDSFGAPRLFGTPDAHYHEGTDIMAAAGTPEFACERGVVSQINPSKLGGNGLWIRGESNTSYYYAHLSGYAAGLHVGQVVEAGDLVGYVGSTGDAQASAPHLHFEIHPNGGPAINPYPLLKAVDDAGHGRPVVTTQPTP